MDRIADWILVVIGGVGMIVSLPAFVLIFIYMVKAMACLKPGIRWRDAPWLNPSNYLFDARCFTEEELEYRRRLGIAIVAFVLPNVFTLLLVGIRRHL